MSDLRNRSKKRIAVLYRHCIATTTTTTAVLGVGETRFDQIVTKSTPKTAWSSGTVAAATVRRLFQGKYSHTLDL
jgi:hypothetical protein